MKLTIITVDGAVYKDNVFFGGLDLSHAPENVHALQWDGVKGWVEFKEVFGEPKPTNQVITELPQWVALSVEKWDTAYAEAQAAEAARLAALEAQQIPASVTGGA